MHPLTPLLLIFFLFLDRNLNSNCLDEISDERNLARRRGDMDETR